MGCEADNPTRTPFGLNVPLPATNWQYAWNLLYARRGLILGGLLLLLINRASGLVAPASGKYWIDHVVSQRDGRWLIPLSLACLSAVIVQAATSLAIKELFDRAAARLKHQVQKELQAHLGRLPVSFYDGTNAGVLTSRVMDDVGTVQALLSPGPIDLLGGILSCGLAFAFMFHINTDMALICVGFVLGLFLLGYQYFSRIRPLFQERWEAQGKVSGRLMQTLSGTRTIKIYQAEGREAINFARGLAGILKWTYRATHAMGVLEACSLLLIGGTSTVLMLVGAYRVKSGAMTVGDLVTFTLLQSYLILPAHQIVLMVPKLSEIFVGLDRIRELLSVPPEDGDPTRVRSCPELKGDIVFDDVGFSYQPGSPKLEHISFEARQGSTTALVGSSGSGKSTIASLIATLYVPTTGTIYLDGINLSTICLDSYRGNLGVVTQDTFLFDDSIRQNILFSRPGATEREFLNACRIACVDEFAEQCRDGYDTMIGDRGIRLSGGQRQRLSIARALLADPRILILDEATSSLDSESENMIRKALSLAIEGRTAFIIAHRLSTVRAADQIVVVEMGRIIERGRHDYLLQRPGRYHDLYTSQHAVAQDRLGDFGERSVESGSRV